MRLFNVLHVFENLKVEDISTYAVARMLFDEVYTRTDRSSKNWGKAARKILKILGFLRSHRSCYIIESKRCWE